MAAAPCPLGVRGSFVLLALVFAGACAGDDEGGGAGAGGGGDAPDSGQGNQGADAAPAAAGVDAGTGTGMGTCGEVREHQHSSMAAPHVMEPQPASAYNSRPPSSGPHCPTWGRYATYGSASPLPACNFIHNLEHGAIVLLYDCPDGCADLVAQLEAVIDEVGPDPDCTAQGIQRIVLTPYAEMDAKIAAAAWGFTFTADCLDDEAIDALIAFVQAHWGTRGDAPEPSVCAQGA